MVSYLGEYEVMLSTSSSQVRLTCALKIVVSTKKAIRGQQLAYQCSDGLTAHSAQDGRVDKASATGAVDSGLISIQVKPITLKLVFFNFPT